VLLEALRSLDPAILDARGASRTDAGVHARGQLVAFDPERSLPPAAWLAELNRRLPDDLVVTRARGVERGFVPRFENLGKRYTYLVRPRSLRDPLERRRAWVVPFPVDFDRMASEIEALVGTHDFCAFRRATDERVDTVRTMARAEVASEGDLLRVTVEGTGFMYNMVRIIVGTVVEVGAGRRAPGALSRAIASGDRRDLGITAPPQGLCLERIFLATDDDLPLEWTKIGKKQPPSRVLGGSPTSGSPTEGSSNEAQRRTRLSLGRHRVRRPRLRRARSSRDP
jgi:tRNA pseudouridine38-40 synthase